MGFFSRFERRVEDGFEGLNDKLFDAPISPVQIAKKCEKQMRREKMVGAGKEFAPTLYTILVNPDDDDRLFGYYPTLSGETETYLRAKAMGEGLVMDGNPLVRFIVDDELKSGKFDVIAELVSAPIVEQLRAEEMERYGLLEPAVPQFNNPIPATPVAPIAPIAAAGNFASSGIDVMVDDPMLDYDNYNNYDVIAEPVSVPSAATFQENAFTNEATPAPPAEAHLTNLTTGRNFPLIGAVRLGRGSDCDITVQDLNASRMHAEIRPEAATKWVVSDLGSTNGTLVNGRHIASAFLNEGDRITIGTTTFLFSLH